MTPAADGSADDTLPAGTLRAIWLLVASTFVVFLNETTMGVALKPIMTDLRVGARTGQWLTTAFMLTMAVVIPVTGYLLQRLRTRVLFGTALTLFCLGTALALLAPGFGLLLTARVVQACGTAIMLPLLMTSLMTLVPQAHRGRMMGNVSIVLSVAPAVGPTLSGVLLSLVGWRGIFATMLPIGVAMLVVGLRLLDDVSEVADVPLDVVSVLLSAAGFGGLVYGLSQVGGPGGGGATMLVCLGVGGLALLLFVLRQLRLQRRERALLDLRTFRYPQFSVALAMMALLMASLFGVVIVLPIYLQAVRHLEPVQVGLLLLPGGLLMGLLGPSVGRWYDRYGPRLLVVPGTVATSAVMWSLTLLDEHSSPWFVLAAHVVLSVGLALTFTPLFTSSLGAVPQPLYGHASATLGALQQVAGAAGTALFVTLMASGSARLTAAGVGAQAAGAGGARYAFIAGALLSVLPIAGAFVIRKPAAATS